MRNELLALFAGVVVTVIAYYVGTIPVLAGLTTIYVMGELE